MNNHTIVCPFDEDLIEKLSQKKLVVRTDDSSLVSVIKNVTDRDVRLRTILLEPDEPLSSVAFREDWEEIPIVLYPSEFGSFREFIHKLPLLKKLKLKVFFSTDNQQNYIHLRILSSLGIHCGIIFGEKLVNWDLVNDLMHYALYSKSNHAPIEPFQYIASNYRADQYTDYSSVYFDNPSKYLHINKKEQIALMGNELEEGKFIAEGVHSLNTISEIKEYKKRVLSWQEFLLQKKGCAYCPGWRVCIGKFSSSYEKNPGCRDFFSDVMDAADYFKMQKKQSRGELWQS